MQFHSSRRGGSLRPGGSKLVVRGLNEKYRAFSLSLLKSLVQNQDKQLPAASDFLPAPPYPVHHPPTPAQGFIWCTRGPCYNSTSSLTSPTSRSLPAQPQQITLNPVVSFVLPANSTLNPSGNYTHTPGMLKSRSPNEF